MIFGKTINRYYLKHLPVILLGIIALIAVDYFQLKIPELYKLVLNGISYGEVTIDGETLPFTLDLVAKEVCLPLIFVLVFGGMTAVETLSQMDILPTGAEVWEMLFPSEPLKDFRISYKVGAGGYLIGEANQTVTEGEYSSRVLAVADDGYMFYGWSDQKDNPSRRDMAVDRHIEVTAIFIKVEEAKDNTEDEDEPDDVPGEGQGESSDSAEGVGGGKYIEINQIIDGKEYYRDHYEEYYARVIALAESGEQIPEELLAIVEAYFNVIK